MNDMFDAPPPDGVSAEDVALVRLFLAVDGQFADSPAAHKHLGLSRETYDKARDYLRFHQSDHREHA